MISNTQIGLDRIGLDWIVLDWIVLDWIRSSNGLDRIGSDIVKVTSTIKEYNYEIKYNT